MLPFNGTTKLNPIHQEYIYQLTGGDQILDHKNIFLFAICHDKNPIIVSLLLLAVTTRVYKQISSR
ncbi:hypothetical protein D3C73_1448320 [compost metagenome]